MTETMTVKAIGQSRVTRAIARSAERTGVDFNYLLGQAKIESSLNPSAKARTSSATGLYQFIDQSWLGVVERHGDKYGLGWATSAIKNTGKGRLDVADQALKHRILELRKNPEVAAAMAGEHASDNKDFLENRLKISAAPVDLYLAHFLGPNGASKFLTLHNKNPDAAAAPHMRSAARANHSIFYAKNGTLRSFADIRQNFAAKLEAQSASNPSSFAGQAASRSGNELPTAVRSVQPKDYLRLAQQRPASAAKTSAPHYNESAHMAYMLLASLGAIPK